MHEPGGLHARWCGPGAILLVGSRPPRLVRVDLTSGKRLEIPGSREQRPVGCSPDGQWMVYSRSGGFQRGQDGTHRLVLDFWRQHAQSTAPQKFATGIFSGRMAPSAAILVSDAGSATPTPPPQWRVVAPRTGWGHTVLTTWFPDSAGFAAILSSQRFDRVGIEILGPSGWAAVVEPRLGALRAIAVDSRHHIYLLATPQKFSNRGSVYECAISDKRIVGCEPILTNVTDFALVRDNLIAFMEWPGNCIRTVAPRSTSRCIALRNDWSTMYLQGASSDGRAIGIIRLAVNAAPPTPLRAGRSYIQEAAFSVVKLPVR
jgi:hypothetical protein